MLKEVTYAMFNLIDRKVGCVLWTVSDTLRKGCIQIWQFDKGVLS